MRVCTQFDPLSVLDGGGEGKVIRTCNGVHDLKGTTCTDVQQHIMAIRVVALRQCGVETSA